MPHFQPLPTRLRDGVVAVALCNQNVCDGPGRDRPLPHGLSRGAEVVVFGEAAIGAGKRWWRVREAGEAGFAWTVECDCDRYYLEPMNAA